MINRDSLKNLITALGRHQRRNVVMDMVSRTRRHRVTGHLLLLFLSGTASAVSIADTVHVAVAANFTAPMKEIIKSYEETTGHKAVVAFGSSGKFYAQISHGAPFEVFLSADEQKPTALIDDGLAVESSRFTYALGALALWSADATKLDDSPQALIDGDFNKLAIANERLAPYGQAALETLAKLDLSEQVQKKLVKGENITQTFQFVSSGNAQLGFVAVSQIWQQGSLISGSAWLVPETYHNPIKQDAVLLNKGIDNAAAADLLEFMKSDAASKIITAYGYRLEE